MRPAIFLAGWLVLGELFALQDYAMGRSWSNHPRFGMLLVADGLYFLLWGIASQILWWKLRRFIEEATLRDLLIRLIPLSVVVSIAVVALWVGAFPHGVLPEDGVTYWQTLRKCLNDELINNIVIFWVVISLFRGTGYYHKLREKEYVTMRMETELKNAQLRALRMQLNPHFLFNTLNSISSLMRSDVEAADLMLERMSWMLRMSLDRGDARFIPLTDEIEFIQLYLSIQKMRFAGTVHHYVAIEPDVLDAQVPAMILQPIVENAYLHGVARTMGEAFLGIEAQREDGQLRVCVRNSGRGIGSVASDRKSVGIANVRSRLELHYGVSQSFTLKECSDGEVQAILLFPLKLAHQESSRGEYGYDN